MRDDEITDEEFEAWQEDQDDQEAERQEDIREWIEEERYNHNLYC